MDDKLIKAAELKGFAQGLDEHGVGHEIIAFVVKEAADRDELQDYIPAYPELEKKAEGLWDKITEGFSGLGQGIKGGWQDLSLQDRNTIIMSLLGAGGGGIGGALLGGRGNRLTGGMLGALLGGGAGGAIGRYRPEYIPTSVKRLLNRGLDYTGLTTDLPQEDQKNWLGMTTEEGQTTDRGYLTPLREGEIDGVDRSWGDAYRAIAGDVGSAYDNVSSRIRNYLSGPANASGYGFDPGITDEGAARVVDDAYQNPYLSPYVQTPHNGNWVTPVPR